MSEISKASPERIRPQPEVVELGRDKDSVEVYRDFMRSLDRSLETLPDIEWTKRINNTLADGSNKILVANRIETSPEGDPKLVTTALLHLRAGEKTLDIFQPLGDQEDGEYLQMWGYKTARDMGIKEVVVQQPEAGKLTDLESVA